MIDPSRLRERAGVLTEEELAAMLEKDTRTLRDWRNKRIGPKWLNAGRTVMYRLSSLYEWLEDQETRSAGPDPRV